MHSGLQTDNHIIHGISECIISDSKVAKLHIMRVKVVRACAHMPVKTGLHEVTRQTLRLPRLPDPTLHRWYITRIIQRPRKCF